MNYSIKTENIGASKYSNISSDYFDSKQIICSVAFILAILGYWSLAPILELLAESDTDQTYSIIQRSLTILLVVISFLLVKKYYEIPFEKLSFFIFYVSLFLYRMYDNFLIEKYQIHLSASTTFLLFLFSGIIPALLFTRCINYFNSRIFGITILILSIVFSLGMFFNLEKLQETQIHRITLEKVNPISITNISLGLLLGLAIFFKYLGKLKLLAVAVAPILILSAVYSKSRGPVVGTIFSLLMLFILGNSKVRLKTILQILVFVAIIIVLMQLTGINVIELLFSRFEGGSDYGASTVTDRELMWTTSWTQFSEDPIFGRYIYNTTFMTYPHNLFFEALIATGIVGTAFLLIFVIQATFASSKILRVQATLPLDIFICAIFYKELMQSMFSGASWAESTLWITGVYLIVRASIVSRKSMANLS